jgi:hypothetical protein
LSVDIGKTARELISLLEKVSSFQEKWYVPAVLKQMITRYYRFMQLKAIYLPNILLIPTLDVEIIWQTHLLRPEMYRADCLRLFGRLVDHSLLATDMERFLKEQAFRETCQLYEQRFGEQYCPLSRTKEHQTTASNASSSRLDSPRRVKEIYTYWDQTYFEFSSDPPKDYENCFSFTEADITLDGLWLDLCKQFMSDSIKRTPGVRRSSNQLDLGGDAMQRLEKSYERFLYMAAKYPLVDGNGFVPPTYAV